jgi:hypothetical protein
MTCTLEPDPGAQPVSHEEPFAPALKRWQGRKKDAAVRARSSARDGVKHIIGKGPLRGCRMERMPVMPQAALLRSELSPTLKVGSR